MRIALSTQITNSFTFFFLNIKSHLEQNDTKKLRYSLVYKSIRGFVKGPKISPLMRRNLYVYCCFFVSFVFE